MASLRIASPCTASWDGMRVVNGGRHCETCDKQVHDLTRMTETEAIARALLFGGSALCGRLLVVAAAAAFGAGCGAPEPEVPASPAGSASTSRADSPAVCEPTAKIVEAEPPPVASSGAAVAAPVRIIVTTMGDLQVLRQVMFRPGESALDAEDEPLLEEVAKILVTTPDIRKVLVKGHTDKHEPRADKLSRARADIVISFLVSRGVQAARLEPRGLGAEQPMDDQSTPDGRARNRRVEFQIVNE